MKDLFLNKMQEKFKITVEKRFIFFIIFLFIQFINLLLYYFDDSSKITKSINVFRSQFIHEEKKTK